MKVIVPCCGRSTRYPNDLPKWMLPSHDGRPMVARAVEQLLQDTADLVITILREHEEKFHVSDGLRGIFSTKITVVVLDQPTRSQADTVAQTLARAGIEGPFMVKDSDNTFALPEMEQPFNYVCVDSLNNHDAINPRNKSYLQVDHQGLVTNIREKTVISDLFSVGGYFFLSPAQFLERYARLLETQTEWRRELYISDVIGALILDGVPFRTRSVSSYQDWGTIHEWKRSLLARRTFFVLLDGFVLERGSAYFRPRFADVQPNPAAIEALRELQAAGHSLVYLSIRDEQLSSLTQEQLRKAGAPAGRVVYDCPISLWVLLTSADGSLPIRSSDHLELRAADPHLLERMLGDG